MRVTQAWLARGVEVKAAERSEHALSDRIRRLGQKRDYLQEDHCGPHRTYMGGIERGEHNLTIQTVLTVAKGLGITMSGLVSGIEKQG